MKLPIILAFLLFAWSAQAQYGTLTFDNGITSVNNVHLLLDSADTIWQVGNPNKTLFHEAHSLPNALVTKINDPYPIVSDSSVVTFLVEFQGGPGVLTVQWDQKIDLEEGVDGVTVWYSTNGYQWLNLMSFGGEFEDYGYQSNNIDTINGHETRFTGTDTTWRTVQEKFDPIWDQELPIYIRFVLKTDTVNTNQEGFMIDNFSASLEGGLSTPEDLVEEHLRVYPSVTDDLVHIASKQSDVFQEIQSIQVINLQGIIVKEYKQIPPEYYIHMSDLSEGVYYLKIKTSSDFQVFPVIVSR